MSRTEIQIRYAPRTSSGRSDPRHGEGVRPTVPSAWLLSGGRAEGWLRELADWKTPHVDVRILVLRIGDQDPLGALAIPLAAESVSPSDLCIPYGSVANCLYMPLDAVLDPPVRERELVELCDPDSTAVWHPATGLIESRTDDLLRVSDLLQSPAVVPSRWSFASSGVRLPTRLTSIQPQVDVTIESIFEQARGDIGTEQDSLGDLPPGENEPSSDLFSRAARTGTRYFANMLKSATESLGGKSGWAQSIEHWANSQLSRVSSSLEALRNKEINRLIDMLGNDPDEALKFAIPMDSGNQHRGRAQAGGHLARHGTDFSLGRLGGGGGPADYWHMSYEVRSRLVNRYRELATREMNLGRFRRAAYVYAELLGDYEAAARALEAGQHWQEAAVLFRDRLRRPLEAARCLQRGGLWMEAIKLYDEIGEHEKAGDLFMQLDQRENAIARFTVAAERKKQQADYLSAAKIYEQKIEDVDQALCTLRGGWPGSGQAEAAVREYFQVCGRHGRHDSARGLVESFRDDDEPARKREDLPEILADVAEEYVDAQVQVLAADCTLRIIAQLLPQASPGTQRKVLHGLRKLQPEDRLLDRDCQRYMYQQVSKSSVRPEYSKDAVQPVGRFSLARHDVRWKAAIASGPSIFVAGMGGYDNLVVNRCSWTHADAKCRMWTLRPLDAERQILLAAAQNEDDTLIVHMLGAESFASHRVFAPTNGLPNKVTGGGLTCLSPQTIAAGRTNLGVTWIIELDDPVTAQLRAFSPAGFVMNNVLVRDGNEEVPRVFAAPVPMWILGEDVYFAQLENLMVCTSKGRFESLSLSQPIQQIVGAFPNTRTRIVAAHEHGGTILWGRFADSQSSRIATDMESPQFAITRTGHVVAVSGRRAKVYSTVGGEVKLLQELKLASSAVAVVAAPHLDQFAVLTDRGTICVYKCTR